MFLGFVLFFKKVLHLHFTLWPNCGITSTSIALILHR